MPLALGTIIELQSKTGGHITLNHALFVPNAAVRLISVYSMTNDTQNSCHFNATSCTVTHSDGTTLLAGKAWKQRRLYTIDCTAHDQSHPTDIALYTTRTPDVETWHRRLGHCDHRTVIDMAGGSATLWVCGSVGKFRTIIAAVAGFCL